MTIASLFVTYEKTDRDGDIAGKDNTNGDDHPNNNHDHDNDNDNDNSSASGSSSGGDGSSGNGGNGGTSTNNKMDVRRELGELRKTLQPQNSHRSDTRTLT